MPTNPVPATVRSTPSAWVDAWHLLRPRQWLILTFQLLVGVACAADWSAVFRSGIPWSQADLALGWFAWVVCLNGGTLAFNSAWDKDTNSVAYLEHPPTPPSWLAAASSWLMIIGVGAGLFVSSFLGLIVAACAVLSWAYSHPAIRLKGLPGADLAVNMVGYGLGTTLAGLTIGRAAVTGSIPGVDLISPIDGGWWLAIGFGLLFGSFYPMTQIYQMDDDRERGDRTLTLALGAQRSLDLALVLGLLAGGALLRAVFLWGGHSVFVVVTVAVWVVLIGSWRRACPRLSNQGHAKRLDWALRAWALVDVGVLLACLA